MNFTFSEDRYSLLKTIDFSELGEDIQFFDNAFQVWVARSQISLLQIIIDEEITTKGLTEDQNQATPYGWRLYDLYDNIYDQIQAKM